LMRKSFVSLLAVALIIGCTFTPMGHAAAAAGKALEPGGSVLVLMSTDTISLTAEAIGLDGIPNTGEATKTITAASVKTKKPACCQ
jgi:hypothetical protein